MAQESKTETYRGEVYDDGAKVNFRLEPVTETRTFKTDRDFQLSANNNLTPLVKIAREIEASGEKIIFLTTEQIRDIYRPNPEAERMRGFTQSEQQQLLAA